MAGHEPGHRPWQLKVYVVGLAAMFVIAAGANVAYQRRATSNDARESATADAGFGAEVAARDLAGAIRLVRTTVAATAATPGLAAVFDDPTGCALSFAGAGPFTTGHLDIVSRDGVVACSSLATTQPSGYTGDAWLAASIEHATFVGPLSDARTGKQVVLTTSPIEGRGAVVALLDLDALGPGLAASLGGPRGLEFVVTDADGSVVLSRSIAAHGSHDRLNGQATVDDLGWTVTAGASRSEALAAATRLANRQLAITLVALALVLAAAMVIHRRIARPIGQLSAGVRAATAHTSSGTIAVAGPAEVSRLVDDFNHLIAAANRELEATSRLAAVVESAADDRDSAETDRRALEDRLHRSERLGTVGQLASGIAHDFNNMLAAIMNYATFVAEETADNPGVQADVAQIQSAAEKAARLTKQLLTFSRRESIQLEVLDLNEVVAEMHNLLSRCIGEHILLTVEPEASLSSIRADRGQMEQALLNLAVNARDAMPRGGTLSIQTSPAELGEGYARLHPGVPPGHYVELEVSDTGTGMSKDVLARIFEPFFTTKAEGTGTGLGLATVFGIVSAAEGSMCVFSEEDAGTTFRLYFPAIEAPVEVPTGAGGARRGHGETVLVVEDEPAILELTSRILRHNGYVVLEAATFDEAISLATNHGVHLLLTDSVPPPIAGRTLEQRIDELHPGRPVLYMSGSKPGILDQGTARLQKPFNQRALLESVQASLG